MNDFRSETPDTMVLEPLRETVDRYKNNPQEVASMSRELEKWRDEERAEGRAEGLQEGEHKGIKKGEANLAALLKQLKADGRFQDMDKVLDSEEYRKKMYQEYQIGA